MPIIIPTGVHVHICSDRVSLVGVKLSCTHLSLVSKREAHAIFLSLFCELYRLL